MNTELSVEAALAQAKDVIADADVTRDIGGDAPQFELFHFALSLCSQKVRACLAEKACSYTAHDINVGLPLLGNYDPTYVRLRLMSRPDARFAQGYTGRSSVETEGFDPAVVPTLVDIDAGLVISDSADIIRYIDEHTGPERSLIPSEMKADITREMAIVDATPHVALLYGAHPDIDFRPKRLRKGMPGVHDRKIEKIKSARALSAGDDTLVAAFDAKIGKEEAGKAFVATPERMKGAVAETLKDVAELNERLSDGRRFICGNDFTMADVVWSVSLFRLKWLGMAFAWEGDHALNPTKQEFVDAYCNNAFARSAFRDAIIDWPGVPRSEYVSEHYED